VPPHVSVTRPLIPCLLSVAKIALSTEGVRMLNLRLFLLFALLSAGAHAQWLTYPTPGTPRTRDGKPNLTAPAPRTSDGKPDLSGVAPMRPEAAELLRKNRATAITMTSSCLPLSIPGADMFAYSPFKILQTKGVING